MKNESSLQNLSSKAAAHVSVSAVVGIIAGIIVGVTISWTYAPLAAWDIAALTFLVWMGVIMHGRDAEQTEELATREDPGRAVSDVLFVFASIASLVAVGVILSQASKSSGRVLLAQTLFSVISVVISWTIIHIVHTLRYAREYYSEKGGIDFNDKHQPRYSDFAYMAFTVGMTFQVADTNLQSNKIRRVVLRHAMLSYLFGTVIVAVTINLLAGLGK